MSKLPVAPKESFGPVSERDATIYELTSLGVYRMSKLPVASCQLLQRSPSDQFRSVMPQFMKLTRLGVSRMSEVPVACWSYAQSKDCPFRSEIQAEDLDFGRSSQQLLQLPSGRSRSVSPSLMGFCPKDSFGVPLFGLQPNCVN